MARVSDLQRICAITDHVTATMGEFLRYQPTTSHPNTRCHQRRMAVELKKAAFRVRLRDGALCVRGCPGAAQSSLEPEETALRPTSDYAFCYAFF